MTYPGIEERQRELDAYNRLPPSRAPLEKRIEELMERIAALEKRVKKLEK